MSRPTPKNIARLTHVLEMAVAAGVLAALAVPAILFPAIRANPQANWLDPSPEVVASPTGETYAARSAGNLQSSYKEGPKVAEHFAVQAIQRLSDRFEFSRRMVTALPHVTDADIAELVELSVMGNVEATGQPIPELVYWDWLIHLESLTVADTQVTDAAFSHIERLNLLEELNVARTQITDDGLACVARLPKLESLVLCENDRITDQGVKCLAGSGLVSLDLAGTSVTDVSVRQLAKIPNLSTLYLCDTRTTNASLEAISELTKLQELSLANCKIDDRGIRHLAGLSQLQLLGLSDTGLTNEGLEELLDLQQLMELSIGNTKVDARGRSMLRAALPACELGD
ncbi:MAG: hypothetical protein RIC55_35235 [Pirellulaceae bacterium]